MDSQATFLCFEKFHEGARSPFTTWTGRSPARPTYAAVPVACHVTRLAPWRVLLAPLVSCSRRSPISLELIDRGRLKEINLPAARRPASRRSGWSRWSQSFADRQVTTNILPGARARLAEDKAAGRRLVLATASYRLYAAAIAQRLGFDDVIATDTEYRRAGPHRRAIDGVNCYGLGKLDMIEAWLQQRGAGARRRPHPLLFGPCLRRPRPPLGRRGLRHQRPCPPDPARRAGGLGGARLARPKRACSRHV